MPEVFQTPVLFGIPKVKLDLAPQTVIVHEWYIRQGQVTAEQHNMGLGLGAQVGLGDDDDIQELRALLMEQLHLVQAGLDGAIVKSCVCRAHAASCATRIPSLKAMPLMTSGR